MDRELVLQSESSTRKIITIDILTKLGKHFGVVLINSRVFQSGENLKTVGI